MTDRLTGSKPVNHDDIMLAVSYSNGYPPLPRCNTIESSSSQGWLEVSSVILPRGGDSGHSDVQTTAAYMYPCGCERGERPRLKVLEPWTDIDQHRPTYRYITDWRFHLVDLLPLHLLISKAQHSGMRL